MIFLTVTAFGAGLLASLSPCVYPMLPITIGYLTKQSSDQSLSVLRKKLLIFSFFIGQVVTFTLLGLIAVKLGEILGFSSQSRTVNFAVAALLFMMAAVSILPQFQEIFAKINRYVPQTKRGSTSIYSGLVFGATSALVASPCTSPVLGGVLGQISSQGNFFSGLLQMFAFALGMGLLFLLLGLGLLNMKRLPRSGQWMNRIHHVTSGFLFVAAGYYTWIGFQS